MAVKNSKTTPRASIIVVVKTFPNEDIGLMLNSTAKMSFNFEVIIVSYNIQHDVTSIKLYLDRLLSSIPSLVKIRVLVIEGQDKGLPYGRNVGAILAESPILIFADDDTILVDDIKDLLTYIENGLCDGAQPLILKLHNPEIIDSSGDFLRRSRLRITFDPYCRWAGMSIKDIGRKLYIEEIPSMRGAFMVISKKAVFSVGGFDSTYKYNFDDVDLGWRMQIAGYRLLFIPTIKVLHKGGRTTDPAKKDEEVYRLGLLNYYATHLKIASHVMWPLLLGLFYIKLFRFELSRIRTNRVNFINMIRDFTEMNKLFIERIKAAIIYRNILMKRFSLARKKKLEEMARGKRFVYGKCAHDDLYGSSNLKLRGSII